MDLGDDEIEEDLPSNAQVSLGQPAPGQSMPSQGSPARAALPPAPDAAAASAEAAGLAPGQLPALCAGLVEQQTIIAERAPPVPQASGCSLPVPVRLTAVRLADGNLATLSPAATLRCEAAVAIAAWIREDIGPAAAALGTRVETVRVADSYDCRPRNRVKGARMSEHGMGNAFDTYGYTLADKRVIEVKNGTMPIDFQNAMKDSACARFSTVLGPGSDGFHEDHIHVDLAVRRLDIRLCRWKIKTPTPPQVARTEPAGRSVVAAAPQSEQAGQATAKGAEAEPEEDEAADVPLPPRRPASLPRSRPVAPAPRT